jgi:pilus assembly protein Flp/PilA
MKELLNRFVREEDGQDLVEYALLLALISLLLVGAIGTLRQAIEGKFTQTATTLEPGTGGTGQ